MTHDLVRELDRLRAHGPVGRAVVIEIRGSAPRAPGAMLLATADGAFAGSLAGGCVEGAAVEAIADALRTGVPRVVTYGLDDPTGWSIGLACGGAIRAFVEPGIRPEIAAFAASQRGGVVATIVAVRRTGTATAMHAAERSIGASIAVDADGRAGALLAPLRAPGDADAATNAPATAVLASVADAVRAAAAGALAGGASRCVELTSPAGDLCEVFLEVVSPPPRLVVYGATEIGAALVALAKVCGWRTVVADARPAFLVAERFPSADEIVRGWPEEVFAGLALDAQTAVCVLTHDAKLDAPALRAALASPAPYVGLIGSRKTQAARRADLRAAGVGENAIARIRGPVGLDLRGRSAADIALAILAEITARRHGGTGRPLAEG